MENINQFWIADKHADANSNDLFEQAKAYNLGIGVKQDKQKAASLYREAMSRGDKRAKHNLALLYITQEGDNDAISKGIQMLQELSNEGLAASVYTLGGCYMTGKGVVQDTSKALGLYRKASDMGLGIATYSIGAYYINDCHDIGKGVEYCEKATEQGFAHAA